MERAAAAGRFGQGAVELELENVGQEVARVGHVGGHVVFSPGIELRLATLDRRRDALILSEQLPPGLVVLFRA